MIGIQPAPRRRRATIFRVVAFALAMILALIIAEIGFRCAGCSPDRREKNTLEPADARPYTADDRLGYVLSPNQRFKTTFPTEVKGKRLSVVATTNAAGHRITHPSTPAPDVDKEQLWVMGCSHTYGVAVDDQDTYPWILQSMLPELEVVNFGVPGYGTLQSLIQLEAEFERTPSVKAPKLIVLLYYIFHDMRNVCSPGWRRSLSSRYNIPYVALEGNGQLERHKAPIYEPTFPLTGCSALSNFLEERLVARNEIRAKEQDHREDVTERLVEAMAALASKHGTRLLVFSRGSYGAAQRGLNGQHVVDFCRRENILVEPIELAPNEEQDPTLSMRPFDRHPSPKAHALLASKMLPTLKRIFSGSAQ